MPSELMRDELTIILKAARHQPRPGWEARALATVAGLRPRRHPNLVPILVAILVLLLLAAGVFAAVRLLIPGALEFMEGPMGGGPGSFHGHSFAGEVEWTTGEPPNSWANAAAKSGRLAFEMPIDDVPPTRTDIWVSDPEGGNVVNLTAEAGIGGVNCYPKWSPDETMILFLHCDPVEGLKPCKAGFHLFLINADGSGAREVAPGRDPPLTDGVWFPDSFHLVAGGDDGVNMRMDIWARDARVLPNVGSRAAVCPDGSLIVSHATEEDEVRGQSGVWRRLVLTDANGDHPRTLAEHFIRDADIVSHRAQHAQDAVQDPDLRKMTDAEVLDEVRVWVGPMLPVWSPDGTKIAFLAAMPFDPNGVFYRDQIEVWVYDLQTDQCTRITHDNVQQNYVRWTLRPRPAPRAGDDRGPGQPSTTGEAR